MSDIGQYHLYRLSEVVQAMKLGASPEAVEHFQVQIQEGPLDGRATPLTLLAPIY